MGVKVGDWVGTGVNVGVEVTVGDGVGEEVGVGVRVGGMGVLTMQCWVPEEEQSLVFSQLEVKRKHFSCWGFGK